ncbi:MAG: isoprenylcysteine carboxylmethyltransferase family protein [Kiritimatiellae bacterium]|nr:isoprenylcysteine carboxylmethyltransferase family protein [Kiritimatiellia bacterium]
MNRLISTVLATIFVASIALFPLTVIFWKLSPAFNHKTVFAILFILIIAQKMWTMFYGMHCTSIPHPIRDLTMMGVGVSYTLTMYVVIIEFFLRQGSTVSPIPFSVGMVFYLAAIGLYEWAARHLQRAANKETAAQRGTHELITDGPYAIIRHPIYTSSSMEAIGIPMIFGSWIALCVGVFVFLPLEILRSRKEDRVLTGEFGDAYRRYRQKVPALVPGLYRLRGTHQKQTEQDTSD